MDTFRPGTSQKVTISATSTPIANPIGAQIRVVRLAATTDCYYVLGAAPTATANDVYLPANAVEYVAIAGGEKVAFIQAAAGGTGHVTEMTR